MPTAGRPTMPKLIADLFLSVDGYARGTRSPAYFGYDGPDLNRWIREQKERPHRHIMGRKTYEALAALPATVRDEGWNTMVNTPTILFSRTLHHTSWPYTTICADEPHPGHPQVQGPRAVTCAPLAACHSCASSSPPDSSTASA
jgi:hypothetical protein